MQVEIADLPSEGSFGAHDNHKIHLFKNVNSKGDNISIVLHTDTYYTDGIPKKSTMRFSAEYGFWAESYLGEEFGWNTMFHGMPYKADSYEDAFKICLELHKEVMEAEADTYGQSMVGPTKAETEASKELAVEKFIDPDKHRETIELNSDEISKIQLFDRKITHTERRHPYTRFIYNGRLIIIYDADTANNILEGNLHIMKLIESDYNNSMYDYYELVSSITHKQENWLRRLEEEEKEEEEIEKKFLARQKQWETITKKNEIGEKLTDEEIKFLSENL